MSDISNDVNSDFCHLTEKFTPDPYYLIVKSATSKIISKYGPSVKTSKTLIHKAIYEDNLIQDEAQQIEELLGRDRVETFKKTVMRDLTYMLRTDKIINVLTSEKVHRPCGNKSCDLCAPKKASERLRYPDITFAILQGNDYDKSVARMNKIDTAFRDLDMDYFPVNLTPSHDNRYIIRIGCLKLDELNPLTPDNDTKSAVALIFESYPEFEEVYRTQSSNQYETVYITKSGFEFTSTDLYTMMPEGQKGMREHGTKRGYSFDAEIGEVIHTTKKQAEKKRDEEDGTIIKFNAPSAINALPDEVKREAMTKTLETTSLHKEKVTFASETNEDIAYNVKRVSVVYVETLEDMGYPQLNIQNSVRLTQKSIDQFNEAFSVPNVGALPDNIMDIDFSNVNRKASGLRDLVALMAEQRMAKAQKKLANCPSIESIVDLFISQVGKPPDK